MLAIVKTNHWNKSENKEISDFQVWVDWDCVFVMVHGKESIQSLGNKLLLELDLLSNKDGNVKDMIEETNGEAVFWGISIPDLNSFVIYCVERLVF